MQITFEIQDDAWPGIIEALATRGKYKDEIDNPSFDPIQPVDENNPRTIPNPVPKETFAIERVLDYVAGEWAAYNVVEETKIATQNAVVATQARVSEVKTGTQVTVIPPV